MKLRHFLLFSFSGLILAIALSAYLLLRNNTASTETKYLFYDGKAENGDVVQQIRDEKLLKESFFLSWMLCLSDKLETVKAGRYSFKPGMSNLDVFRMLIRGDQDEITLVLRGRWEEAQLAGYVASQLNTDSVSVRMALLNQTFLDSAGVESHQVMALILPNSYRFFWNTSAMNFTTRMLKEYRKFWNDERKDKAAGLGLSPLQVSILASIVEKETAKTDEMATIAGVYLNRLKINMPLQADPTVIYANGDPTVRRVAGAMLQLDSPYNTYKYTGLPPGPICIPSLQAVEAVLNAGKHKYLYFCAKEDLSGYHRFSDDYNEHLANARKYQAELNRRGIN